MKASMSPLPFFITCVITVLVSAKLMAEPIVFESSNEQVQLLELYTSEGCSSCPPADRWLSKLKSHPRVWQTFIPVAFHVDYWNRLGWPDRFSNQKFSMRQRRYQNEGSIYSVYTPGFVLAGAEWGQWFSSQSIPDFKATKKKVGILRAEINSGEITVRFTPQQAEPNQNLRAEYALLNFNESTKILRGENEGKVLKHDFAVTQYKVLSAKTSERSLEWHAQLDKEMLKESKAGTRGIAVWISANNLQAPLQVTGGYLN